MDGMDGFIAVDLSEILFGRVRLHPAIPRESIVGEGPGTQPEHLDRPTVFIPPDKDVNAPMR
jgi:hypothetical protein